MPGGWTCRSQRWGKSHPFKSSVISANKFGLTMTESLENFYIPPVELKEGAGEVWGREWEMANENFLVIWFMETKCLLEHPWTSTCLFRIPNAKFLLASLAKRKIFTSWKTVLLAQWWLDFNEVTGLKWSSVFHHCPSLVSFPRQFSLFFAPTVFTQVQSCNS